MAAESEEFERAWAQIVADLRREDDAAFGELPDSTQADSRGGSADQTRQGGGQADPLATSDHTDLGETMPPSTPDPAGTSDSDPSPTAVVGGAAAGLPSPGTERDPAAYLANWAEEGHFTPPAPPEIPAGSPATRLGWAGTLGGVATLVLVSLSGWDPPKVVFWAAGLATLAGFVTLVWQLPESRDDGWDDGAQV